VQSEQHDGAHDGARHGVVVADDAVLYRVGHEQDHEQVERVLLRDLSLAEDPQGDQ